MKKALFLSSFIFYMYLNAQMNYTKGWNLLGAQLYLGDDYLEEIWTYNNFKWILRPTKINKHQGFWFNAPSDGSMQVFDHIFEQDLPSTYDLFSLQLQYTQTNEEINYLEHEMLDSNIIINQNLSYTELTNIQLEDGNVSNSYSGNFVPLLRNTTKIAEYSKEFDTSQIVTISLNENVLVLIRSHYHSTLGEIKKKYTYVRR